MYYNRKTVEILEVREKEDLQYYDFLLPERNVELKSLSPILRISSELKEKDYAIYIKNNFMEIVYINKIDLQYEYAYIQIYKSNVPFYFLTDDKK